MNETRALDCLTQARKINQNLWVTIIVLCGGAACALFALFYVYGEDPAYIWDSRSYWDKYFTSGERLHESGLHWLGNFFKDVWSNDNNSLPSDILLPFYGLFGICREAYITGIILCYLVPACALMAFVFCRLVGAFHTPNYLAWFSVFFAMGLLCPQFWAPSLMGLPDMIGAIPLLFFLDSFRRHDLNKKFSLKNILYWGILLWLPFLFRRWYAYTVISLFTTIGAFAAIDYYRALYAQRAQKDYRALLPQTLIRNYVGIACIVALCALCTQGGFVKHILHTSYGDIYSAYQVLDWRQHFVMFYNHYGFIVIALTLIGTVTGARAAQTRRITLFAVANLVLTCKLFTMTQAFSVHHYIPITIWMLLLQGMAIWSLWHAASQAPVRRSALAALYIVVTFATFTDVIIAPIPVFRGPLTIDTYYQRKLDNYPEYVRLTNNLEALLGDTKKVSVFASNGFFCDSILQSLSHEALSKNIYFASQVDKRDHFDLGTLFSDYIVVVDPVQLHMRPTDQHVVTIPATEIINHVGIGAAYERLPDHYVLGNGSIASVYKKVRPFHIDEVTSLFGELLKFYPEWKDEYGIAAKIYLTGSYNVPDVPAKIRLSLDEGIDMYMDGHLDMIAVFDNPHQHAADPHIENISFSVPANRKRKCPPITGIRFETELDGHKLLTDQVQTGGMPKELVLPSQWNHLKVTATGNGNSICKVLDLRFKTAP